MANAIKQCSATPAAAGRPALIIARDPCVHDSRVMREAHTLRELGYRPQILGVVSEQVRDRRTVQPRDPDHQAVADLPVLVDRSRCAVAHPGSPPLTDLQRRSGGGAAISVAIRVHRWIRTLDYYRRGIGVVRDCVLP